MTHGQESTGPGEPEAAESAELRALYRGLQTPPLAEEAADADPETARVVAWMRGAWDELAIPPVAVSRPVLRPPVRRWRTPTLLVAAAALLLVLTGAALWRVLGPPERRAGPQPVVRGPEPALEPVSPAPSAVPGAVHVLAASDDQFELRSGPVRLVLLTPPTESSRLRPGS